MKTYLKLSLILASSFLLSACGNNKNSTFNQSNSDSASSTFSLRQLIAQNVPQKCTYSGTDESGSYETEIVINGDKFNQTVKVKSPQGESTLHTISDGEYYYTWGVSNGQNFANKMKANFDNSEDSQDYEEEEESFDRESDINLDEDFHGTCTPTTVSDSDFQAPSDIQFTDYSQLMEQWQNLTYPDTTGLDE